MLCNIVACILAGGEGTLFFPLTAHRAKPAVRFGGSYRLIDLTLSNCVNSDICKLLVFPQYKARSLEDHLRHKWSFLSTERDEYLMSIDDSNQEALDGVALSKYRTGTSSYLPEPMVSNQPI